MKNNPTAPSTRALSSQVREQKTFLSNALEEVPLTFKDFTNIYPWPNMGSLRKLAYESETNGLATAFVKFQKRRLVLPQTLFKLLKKGNA